MEAGRRERKKQQTAVEVEWAALELVVTEGLQATTVEAISDRADITSRTFFNYFASKEDAVLGISKAAVSLFDSAELDELSGSPFDRARERIRHLLVEPGQEDARRTKLRREVVKLHPELISREYLHLSSAGHDLRSWVEGLLADDAPSLSIVQRAVEASAIIHTIGAAYQIAVVAWSNDDPDGRSLVDHFDQAFSRIAALTAMAAAR